MTQILVMIALFVALMPPVCWSQDLDVKVHVETINDRVPLALAHLYGHTLTGPLTNMSPYELVRLDIYNGLPRSRTLRLKLDLPGYGREFAKTIRVAATTSTVVRCSPILDPKLVSEVVDERAGRLTVQLEENQVVVYSDTISITLAGKDDVPMYSGSAPLYPFLVTRVQLKSKVVTQVLTDAGQRRSFNFSKGIIGTRGDSGQMLSDVRKIYNTIQETGFVFVNTPVSFEQGYQRIKTPTEALKSKSGNCIDGTLVFASCISAIGYNPLIVLIPGHAFVIATCPKNDLDATRAYRLGVHLLGVRDGKPGFSTTAYTAWFPIETTTMQQRSDWTIGLTQMTFDEAMRTGTAELQKFTPDDQRNKVFIIDVEAWRHCGLLATPDDQ